MVLQEIEESQPQDSTFASEPPQSDSDPYSSSSSPSPSSSSRNGTPFPNPKGTSTYNVDLDKLPQPIYFFFSSKQWREHMTENLTENLKHAAGMVNRPLRQEEVDAIAYHLAHTASLVSYGVPTGTAISALFFYRGLNTFSFPFLRRKPTDGPPINPDRFGALSGPRARLAWHALRFQAYGFIGAVAGFIFFSSYATTVNLARTTADPRLKDYVATVRARAHEHQQQGQTRPQVDRVAGQRNSIDSQEGVMDRQAQRAAARLGMQTQYSRQDVQRRAADYDDMSPSGGSWRDDFVSPDASADTELMSDSQTVEREGRMRADAERNVARDEEREAQSRVRSQARGWGNDADASPQAVGQGQSQKQQEQQQQQPSGNTWERIRAQAAAGKGPMQSARASAWPSADASASTPVTRSSTTSAASAAQAQDGNSFSFSSSDEERQLAKTEAQRDFDARVETERRGGDFAEGSAGVGGKGAWGGWRK